MCRIPEPRFGRQDTVNRLHTRMLGLITAPPGGAAAAGLARLLDGNGDSVAAFDVAAMPGEPHYFG